MARSEKLARLVIGEAKRNAAFRKLVAAALAATKGPAAVAAIIDKRLAGLDRAKAFVDWEKAKTFSADIAATLATITEELGSADPDAAVDRLVRFLSTADRVSERIDDSNGRLQNVYHEAAAALPDRPIDTVKALRPRWIVAGHKDKDLDDDAARVIAENPPVPRRCRRSRKQHSPRLL